MKKTIPIDLNDTPIVILDLLYRLKIRDLMKSKLITAKKDATLRSIQQLMREKEVTGVPIAEGKRLLGIISMDDIICAFDGGYIDEIAAKHMSTNLIVLEEDMPISFAISYFDKYSFHRFPVLSIDNHLVGMITNRDISTRLLREANDLIEKLEERSHIKTQSQIGHTLRQYLVVSMDFEKAGRASTDLKKLLKAQIDAKTLRRISIAAYELEINIVVHSQGGKIIFRLDDEKAEILAVDDGPGIEDVEKALEVGYSTANEFVRSLGFGAGMGLANVKRVSDEFTINSKLGESTEVRSIIYLEKGEKGE